MTTMLLSISAFVLFLVVEVSSRNRGGAQPGRAPMCSAPNKPCSLRVFLEDSLGANTETVATGICTCSPPYTCSGDWTDRRRVVSRRLISTDHNMTLQMMFCRPVQPERFCRPGDVSLVAKGAMLLPMDISSYNCRCRRRQPLVLKERLFGEDNLFHHSYICGNHVQTCDRTTPCMTLEPTSTNYHCQCPQGSHCRLAEGVDWEMESRGFCSPH